MIEFLVAEEGMSCEDASLLCSVSADLRVTQTIDGVKDMHAMLPKSVFK
jgi:acetamidase/formamidase